MSSTCAEHSAPVIIIGAGLTGLAAGRRLASAGVPYLILEAADRPGGLCRTEKAAGFTFDYTGHLLHLKEGPSRDLILDLVGDGLATHTRRASVHVEGVFVDYPIQAHVGQLPEPLARRCHEEMLEAAKSRVPPDASFDRWAAGRFGPTLAGLFMVPYNAKLNVYPIEEMETSWTSWSVPVPSSEELRKIRSGLRPPAYGYNATFRYPREGGIEILPRALAAGQEGAIRTGCRVVGIEARERTITLEGGETLSYASVISTIPLPELLRITEGPSGSVTRAAGKLRHSSVLGVCIGLDGPVNTADHWIYFPERELPFYRVGFPTNFSATAAPAGCGSLYAEAAYRPGSPPDPEAVAGSVLRMLVETGLTHPATGVLARVDLALPFAYVFHDRFRAGHLRGILGALRDWDIHSVGRYGAWEYSAMQDAVDWGLAAAGKVME